MHFGLTVPRMAGGCSGKKYVYIGSYIYILVGTCTI